MPAAMRHRQHQLGLVAVFLMLSTSKSAAQNGANLCKLGGRCLRNVTTACTCTSNNDSAVRPGGFDPCQCIACGITHPYTCTTQTVPSLVHALYSAYSMCGLQPFCHRKAVRDCPAVLQRCLSRHMGWQRDTRYDQSMMWPLYVRMRHTPYCAETLRRSNTFTLQTASSWLATMELYRCCCTCAQSMIHNVHLDSQAPAAPCLSLVTAGATDPDTALQRTSRRQQCPRSDSQLPDKCVGTYWPVSVTLFCTAMPLR